MGPKEKKYLCGGKEKRMEAQLEKPLDELQCIVALTMIDKIGPKTCRSLLERFGGARDVFSASRQSLAKVGYVGEQAAAAIRSQKSMRKAEQEIEFALKHRIKIVAWDDDRYPRKLREIADSPMVFYCKGDLPAADVPHIGIVGTRNPSAYGRRIANEFASYFARLGIVVVSGLAFGIDIEAHSATVATGGRTIAVLGHGLEQVYPREHTFKANEIVGCGGALLSEFPSGTQPEAFNFPARNRVISGLCDAVVVVEATEKGGALITAKMAFEQNREVFAVPGHIGVSTSVGCNRLIRDHVAKIACGPQDVLDGLQHLLQYRAQSPNEVMPRAALSLTGREKAVYTLLGKQALDLDCLAAAAAIDPTTLRGILLDMELQGIVTTAPGNKFKVG